MEVLQTREYKFLILFLVFKVLFIFSNYLKGRKKEKVNLKPEPGMPSKTPTWVSGFPILSSTAFLGTLLNGLDWKQSSFNWNHNNSV